MLAMRFLALEDSSWSNRNLGASWVDEKVLEGSEEGRTNHMGDVGLSPADRSLSS